MGIVDTTEQKRKKLANVFECLRSEVIEHMKNTMSMGVVEWFRRNLDHNVPDGKPNYIMSVVDCMEILWDRALSDDEYFKAALLEWCIKLLQASRLHIYLDDKLNEHRNRQCWYAGDDIVIRDSFWLDVVMYYLLKKYFRMETYYVHLLELFQDTAFQTEMGQLVRLTTASKDQVSLGKLSLQKYALFTRMQVTTFYLPVALAMCVCGIPETYTTHGCPFSPYAVARSILLKLGEYFQVRDHINHMGTIGKVGKAMSGITENGCSWCINMELVISSPQQLKVLEGSYGRVGPEKQTREKETYEMSELKQYRKYEAGLNGRIEGLIMQIPEGEGNVDGCVLKREVFLSFFDKIYMGTK